MVTLNFYSIGKQWLAHIRCILKLLPWGVQVSRWSEGDRWSIFMSLYTSINHNCPFCKGAGCRWRKEPGLVKDTRSEGGCRKRGMVCKQVTMPSALQLQHRNSETLSSLGSSMQMFDLHASLVSRCSTFLSHKPWIKEGVNIPDVGLCPVTSKSLIRFITCNQLLLSATWCIDVLLQRYLSFSMIQSVQSTRNI